MSAQNASVSVETVAQALSVMRDAAVSGLMNEYMAEADQAKVDAQAVAAEIHDLRMLEAGLKRQLSDKRKELELEKISFEVQVINDPQRDFTDPRTKKTNKDYTAMLVSQAMAGDPQIGSLERALRQLEMDLDETQADLSFALDRFSAIRHSARLVTTQLTYLASAERRVYHANCTS
jgi:hypothetical protein